MEAMNGNECLTDPSESGEWAGEEVLTVPLKLQPDGSRRTGAKDGRRGEAKGCSHVRGESS